MSRLILAAMALSVLAGCGLKGGLERPPPLIGREKAEAEERAREQSARQSPAEQTPGIGSNSGGVRPPTF